MKRFVDVARRFLRSFIRAAKFPVTDVAFNDSRHNVNYNQNANFPMPIVLVLLWHGRAHTISALILITRTSSYTVKDNTLLHAAKHTGVFPRTRRAEGGLSGFVTAKKKTWRGHTHVSHVHVLMLHVHSVLCGLLEIINIAAICVQLYLLYVGEKRLPRLLCFTSHTFNKPVCLKSESCSLHEYKDGINHS